MKLRAVILFCKLSRALKRHPDMPEKLKSRKLWVAVVGAALVTLGGELGLDPALVENVVLLAASYILGQGAVDSAGRLADGMRK